MPYAQLLQDLELLAFEDEVDKMFSKDKPNKDTGLRNKGVTKPRRIGRFRK